MSQKNSRPLVVEMLGLPGSGKTHWTGLLATHGDIMRAPQAISGGDILRAVVRYPHCVLRWLLFLMVETVKSGEWALMRYRLSLMVNTFGKLYRARASTGAVVLLDEGFLQRILSVSTRRITPERAASLMRGLWSDYVLVIEAQEPRFHRYGPEHIRSRVSSRNEWQVTMRDTYQVVHTMMQRTEIRHEVVGPDTAPDGIVTKLRTMTMI